MAVQLANALVTVNNNPVPVIPNSVMFTEGQGEQSIRAASVGGGAVEQIYAQNIETNFSTISFDMAATVPNIAEAKTWKINLNQNVVKIVGQTPEGKVIRTFTQAAILNDYEVALGTDTNITVEFKSNQAL